MCLFNIDSNKNTISTDIKIDETVSAPIAANSVIGHITYTVNGVQYKKNLVASHDVEKSDFWIIIFRFILILVLLILFYVFMKSKFKKNKRIY